VLGKLAGWGKKVGESTFHLDRFNIGPRLTLCFLFIILALLVGNGVSLWQFHLARTQADRLRGVDQELIAVLQAHTSLMSFYERLDVLAHSESAGQLVREVEALRNALLQDSRRSRDALSRLPPEVQLDPALLPTLLSIQDTLPAELEAITALAKSNEWEAVRLRLANQVRPLEYRSSGLVENIDREVGEERAQAVLNIGLEYWAGATANSFDFDDNSCVDAPVRRLPRLGHHAQYHSATRAIDGRLHSLGER
jgi:hypothetical protein